MQKLEQAIRDQYVSENGEKSLWVLLDLDTSKQVMVKSHDQVTARLIEIEGLKEYDVETQVMQKMPMVIQDEGKAFQMQMLGVKDAFKQMYADVDRQLAVEYFCVTGEMPVN